MRRALVVCLLVPLWLAAAAAEEPLTGATAPRWSPALGWVSNKPTAQSVENRDGRLVFTARGAHSSVPFLYTLTENQLNGDARYLLVRYQATGYAAAGKDYFLHGWEGMPGGLTFATADQVIADGAPHTLAVDLAALPTMLPTSQLAVKLHVGDADQAVVTVERIWFSDELPAEAKVARATLPPPAKPTEVAWAGAAPEAMKGWTTTPAPDAALKVDGDVATFTVGTSGTGMRWRGTLPQPVDLKALPYLTFRYRAAGQVAPSGYAIWLGNQAAGTGGQAVIAFPSGELKADGVWHTLTLQLQTGFTATHVAVGLDSTRGPVELSFGPLTFSATPPRLPLNRVLTFTPRTEAWPAGRDHLTEVTAPATGGKPGSMMPQRLGLADWFPSAQITVAGLPFAVPTDPAAVRQTGTSELGEVALPLPATAKEVYLLLATAAPPSEPFGVDSSRPRPMELLDVPEKVTIEIRYRTGPSDTVLPLDRESGRWGARRGLGVAVVHPDPARPVDRLVIHDGMETASFAILGATVRDDGCKVAEPSLADFAWPTPPADAVPADSLRTGFATDGGLRWSRFELQGKPGALAADGPVFEVVVDGKVLPPESWQVTSAKRTGPVQTFQVANAGANLAAEVEARPSDNGLSMSLTLRNTGAAATKATLRFPVLRNVRLGSVEDTWYLCDRRGGIINRVPASFRVPLGDSHPLQCDGFFNPRTGVALACLTGDTDGHHHFVDLAKDTAGGSWSPEYPDRDLPAGGTFEATDATLAVVPGDWHAIFGAYRRWLASWYQPPKAKPWWENVFCLVDRFASYEAGDPKVRGAIQPAIDRGRQHLGSCDMVHLFGWSASEKFGAWGDYDHYDETVGGLDYFRGNIANAQAKGVAVSLYQDGFLSSEKGQFAGAHAKEWAMKRPDGSPWYVKEYDSYNECPSVLGWRDYLAKTYARIAKDTGVKVLYVDEYGASDGRWTCYAKDHGHNGTEIPSRGEVQMLEQLRAAVGPDLAMFSEYPGFEANRRFLDGSITYQAVWSVDQEGLAPHFVDLTRFAFPAFKQYHIIHYAPNRAGNQWPMKIPFFNGETYFIGEPGLPGAYDSAALALQRRCIEVMSAHRDAFTSHSVEPLVPTELPGVFANRFAGAKETVWTLYNANGRSVRGVVLRVPAAKGARYRDGWRDQPIEVTAQGGMVAIPVELGPKAVGCVVQAR